MLTNPYADELKNVKDAHTKHCFDCWFEQVQTK